MISMCGSTDINFILFGLRVVDIVAGDHVISMCRSTLILYFSDLGRSKFGLPFMLHKLIISFIYCRSTFQPEALTTSR